MGSRSSSGKRFRKAFTERVVSQVARLVSMGQLPQGRADRRRNSSPRVSTGPFSMPATSRLMHTKLVSGVASR